MHLAGKPDTPPHPYCLIACAQLPMRCGLGLQQPTNICGATSHNIQHTHLRDATRKLAAQAPQSLGVGALGRKLDGLACYSAQSACL